MINHNKAYILGLLLGGATISEDMFTIRLPYEKWGMDTQNMNKIATDILTKICSNFVENYKVPVSYQIGNGCWTIKPVGNPSIALIKEDLSFLGLPVEGIILNSADLTIAKSILKGISAESFLSGIFDARASLSLSHRRFVDQAPVVSLEIPGSTKNFSFIVQICSWLTSLGSVTDQILYNHPCQHSAADPTYKGWKKGFKIRFLVKSFISNHSFAMQAKSFDVSRIEKTQKTEEQNNCLHREIRNPSPVSIHNDINSRALPDSVRNKLFFHYFHFCAVLGCPYAPIKQVKALVTEYYKYITVFPRLHKGTSSEIFESYQSILSNYFADEEIVSMYLDVTFIKQSADFRLYRELEVGLAYLFSKELNGKRHIGSLSNILNENLVSKVKLIKLKNIDMTPLYMENEQNSRAIIISPTGGDTNKKILQSKISVNNLEVTINE